MVGAGTDASTKAGGGVAGGAGRSECVAANSERRLSLSPGNAACDTACAAASGVVGAGTDAGGGAVGGAGSINVGTTACDVIGGVVRTGRVDVKT